MMPDSLHNRANLLHSLRDIELSTGQYLAGVDGGVPQISPA
jgi:hypothetical protein